MFGIKDEAGRKTLYIYGTIGEDFWSAEDSNRAKEFAQALDELSPAPLDIRLDSGGGDVYEGFAIASAIQRYGGETCTYVDGMAASAASYIALMSDHVVMNDFSKFMIHNAWQFARGNSDELRRAADQLDGVNDSIAVIISARTGMELDAVKEAMRAETWYNAEDALECGFCDEVVKTEHRVAACLDRSIAQRYSNVPPDVLITDPEAAAEPQAEGEGGHPQGMEEGVASDPGSEKSHLDPNIVTNEGAVAEQAIVLGNRVYRRSAQC